MNKFECMCFQTSNEEESKQIQQYLFGLGYSWNGVKEVGETDARYLFTESDGTLEFANMFLHEEWADTYPMKGLKVTYELYDLEDLINIDGVMYKRQELVQMIADYDLKMSKKSGTDVNSLSGQL